MSWQDRTRQAAYTSPSGFRFVFNTVQANREFDKNTTAFDFPGVEGTYVQDLGGVSGHRYPMRCIFWGDNHDIEARLFEQALAERGRGRLEHPRDGQISVVPFGRITLRDDLVRAANQTIFEVEFFESRVDLFPAGVTDPAASSLGNARDTFSAAAAVFAANVDLSLPTEVVTLRNRLSLSTGVVRSIMTPIVGKDADILRQFNAVADSITSNLDTLATDPLTIANQVTNFLLLPASVPDSVPGLLDSFGEIINGITGGTDPVVANDNEFRSDELFATSSVAAAVVSSVTGDYRTRSLAVSAAAAISDQFDAVNTWRELNYA